MEARKPTDEEFDTDLHRELATSLTAELERLEASRPEQDGNRLPTEADPDETFALLQKLRTGFRPPPETSPELPFDAPVPKDS